MSELSNFENKGYEVCRVTFELARADYIDNFFSVRPEIERNKQNERLLESGFRMGWDSLFEVLKNG